MTKAITITISGLTGVGLTTTANAIRELLLDHGVSPSMIQLDDSDAVLTRDDTFRRLRSIGERQQVQFDVVTVRTLKSRSGTPASVVQELQCDRPSLGV